jgi:hypothetical protein
MQDLELDFPNIITRRKINFCPKEKLSNRKGLLFPGKAISSPRKEILYLTGMTYISRIEK